MEAVEIEDRSSREGKDVWGQKGRAAHCDRAPIKAQKGSVKKNRNGLKTHHQRFPLDSLLPSASLPLSQSILRSLPHSLPHFLSTFIAYITLEPHWPILESVRHLISPTTTTSHGIQIADIKPYDEDHKAWSSFPQGLSLVVLVAARIPSVPTQIAPPPMHRTPSTSSPPSSSRSTSPLTSSSSAPSQTPSPRRSSPFDRRTCLSHLSLPCMRTIGKKQRPISPPSSSRSPTAARTRAIRRASSQPRQRRPSA